MKIEEFRLDPGPTLSYTYNGSEPPENQILLVQISWSNLIALQQPNFFSLKIIKVNYRKNDVSLF